MIRSNYLMMFLPYFACSSPSGHGSKPWYPFVHIRWRMDVNNHPNIPKYGTIGAMTHGHLRIYGFFMVPSSQNPSATGPPAAMSRGLRPKSTTKLCRSMLD